MKRKGLILIGLVLMFAGIKAQQLPQYSQYMFNNFVYNPAVTGTEDHYQAISNNRYQWVGIVDAPRTYILSVYGPHKNLDMGFGGYIFNDVTGPTSRTGLNLSYAYQFKVTSDINISLGLAGGLLQYKLDATKITFKDEELGIDNILYTDYMPDANAGLYVYGSNFYGGVSANQLLNNRIKIYDARSESMTRLRSHINVHGGYIYAFPNGKYELEPSVLIKYALGAPLQAELNAKFVIEKKIWLGASYRHDDAVSFLFGYNLFDQIFLGYAYDFAVTSIRKHSTGTHELVIGAKFNKLKDDVQEPVE